MQALELLRLAKKHISGQIKMMLISEEIKPVALAIIELCCETLVSS